jgi:hypothetical protein
MYVLYWYVYKEAEADVPKPDYCSNAVTCNGVTVFVTFSVFSRVFDYFLKWVIVVGIKYKTCDVFTWVFSYFLKYSVFVEIYFHK